MAKLKDADALAAEAKKGVGKLKFTRSSVLTKYLSAVSKVANIQDKDKAAVGNALSKLTASQVGIMMVASGVFAGQKGIAQAGKLLERAQKKMQVTQEQKIGAGGMYRRTTVRKGAGKETELEGGRTAHLIGEGELLKKYGVKGEGPLTARELFKYFAKERDEKKKELAEYKKEQGGVFKKLKERMGDTKEAIIDMKDAVVDTTQELGNEILFGPLAGVAESLQHMLSTTFKNIFGIGKEKDEKKMRKDIGKIEKHMRDVLKGQKEQTLMAIIGNAVLSALPNVLTALLSAALLALLGTIFDKTFGALGTKLDDLKMALKGFSIGAKLIKPIEEAFAKGFKWVEEFFGKMWGAFKESRVGKFFGLSEKGEVAGWKAMVNEFTEGVKNTKASVFQKLKGGVQTGAEYAGKGVKAVAQVPGIKQVVKVAKIAPKVLGKLATPVATGISWYQSYEAFKRGDKPAGFYNAVSGVVNLFSPMSSLYGDATMQYLNSLPPEKRTAALQQLQAQQRASGTPGGQYLEAMSWAPAQGTNLQEAANNDLVEEMKKNNDINAANNGQLNVINNNIQNVNSNSSSVTAPSGESGDMEGIFDMSYGAAPVGP